MQSVSEALKKSLDRNNPVYAKTVELYRLVWTGSAYVFDTPIDITNQIKDAGKIMWKFDKEGFNVWSVSNSTLTIRNDRQQWKQGNPKGYFSGNYLKNGSKIKITTGAQLADGTFEKPRIFSGYITTDPIGDTDSKTITVTLEGPMSIFKKFNAEDISTAVTNEEHAFVAETHKIYYTDNLKVSGSGVVVKKGTTSAGPGAASTLTLTTDYTLSQTDDLNLPMKISLVVALTASQSIWVTYTSRGTVYTDEAHAYSTPDQDTFRTDHNGVAASDFVVLRGDTVDGPEGATELKGEIDYRIANQNTKDVPITVTLTDPLVSGESVWFSYKYWYTDKTLDWIVEQVMTLCGISSYSISPAVFSTNIENTWTQTTQADWEADTLSNIDTITTPDSFKIGLIDDFGDGEYTSNPPWTVLRGSGFSIDNGRLKIEPTTSLSVIKLASDKTVGTWEFRLYSWQAFTLNDYCNVYFMATGEEATYKYPTAGYYFHLEVGGSSIKRTDGTVLISTASVPSSTDIIRIERSSAGVIKLYFNSTLIGTSAADLTYTTSDRFVITAFEISDDWPLEFYFDDYYFWEDGTTVGTGSLESTVHDASESVSSWGKLIATYTANGASVTIETYSSGSSDFSTDNDPAGWVAIDESGQILSAVKRYIKFRITATLSSILNPVTPVFDTVSIKYYTSTTTISLVNLTGMTCQQALESCAEKVCYEMGFTPADVFIFRPRSTTVPAVIDLRSGTNVVKLRQQTDGVDRVFNYIDATFGDYKVISSAAGDAEPNSITKYGKKKYSPNSDSLLPSSNANMAYAIAPTILAYTKLPRRRTQAICRFLPYLELGDKGTLYFNEPTAFRQWKWGDTDVVYGDPALEYYDGDATIAQRVSFWGVDMRIEGIEFDWWGASKENGWQMVLDLVEVL